MGFWIAGSKDDWEKTDKNINFYLKVGYEIKFGRDVLLPSALYFFNLINLPKFLSLHSLIMINLYPSLLSF